MPSRLHDQESGPYARDGARKYLNRTERERVLAAASSLKPAEALFVLTLLWSGARVSEILNLTLASVMAEEGLIAIRTLKRRRPHMREVPIPPGLMAALDRHFHIIDGHRDPRGADHRLWPWHRATAWRLVKRLMARANVAGRQACPKGLRHGFGVATLGVVPLNVRQKWMGHARPETTDIYSAVCGPEELEFAARFWAAKSK